jgi:hypothetical protein
MEGIPVTYPVGGNSDGMGIGGGLIGGLVLGSVLNGRGLGYGNDRGVVGESCVTPTLLASSFANATNTDQHNTILQNQGQIKEAIGNSASATQIAAALQFNALGVANAKGFGETMTQNALTSSALGVQVQKTAGDLGVQVALNTAAVGTAVERTGAATALAFKDSAIQTAAAQFAITQAIKADGDLTRAKIDEYNLAALNRQLTVSDIALAEERGFRRSRETEINITNTNTAVAAQAQSQQMQQQQFQILANLGADIRNLYGDVQNIKQGQVIFNSGVMAASGTQAAANTRVA